MNKKGFTLIELVTTLSIAIVLVIIFINIGLIIKNIYNDYDNKTKLLIDQANLSTAIHSKLDKNIKNYSSCADSLDFCFEFNLNDGSKSRLLVTDNLISFDDYKYKIPDNLTVEPEIKKETLTDIPSSDNNSFLILKISIKSKEYKNEDFGINFIYQYNSNITTLEI